MQWFQEWLDQGVKADIFWLITLLLSMLSIILRQVLSHKITKMITILPA